MTTATVTGIINTGTNYIVYVRTDNPVFFCGWNSAVIASVTPIPDGLYLLEGQPERFPASIPTVGQIIAAFEAMASEFQACVDMKPK